MEKLQDEMWVDEERWISMSGGHVNNVFICVQTEIAMFGGKMVVGSKILSYQVLHAIRYIIYV